jgi:DNA-binding FadR family transcriptional regulator
MAVFNAAIYSALVVTFQIGWQSAQGFRKLRLQQHGDIVEAIRVKDPDLAHQCMADLLDAATVDVKEAIKQSAAAQD